MKSFLVWDCTQDSVAGLPGNGGLAVAHAVPGRMAEVG